MIKNIGDGEEHSAQAKENFDKNYEGSSYKRNHFHKTVKLSSDVEPYKICYE